MRRARCGGTRRRSRLPLRQSCAGATLPTRKRTTRARARNTGAGAGADTAADAHRPEHFRALFVQGVHIPLITLYTLVQDHGGADQVGELRLWKTLGKLLQVRGGGAPRVSWRRSLTAGRAPRSCHPRAPPPRTFSSPTTWRCCTTMRRAGTTCLPRGLTPDPTRPLARQPPTPSSVRAWVHTVLRGVVQRLGLG
jgi:hypothetical protein